MGSGKGQSPDHMEVEVDPLQDGITRVAANGPLTEHGVAELSRRLLDEGSTSGGVLLDLTGVDSIDSAGIALLILARIELEATGHRFVVEASPSVRRALQRAGTPRFVNVTVERTSALDALRPLPA